MSIIKNEIGKKYGYLTVIRKVENKNSSRAFWECKCDCGNTIIVNGTDLRSGHTQSCGCKRKEKTNQHNLEMVGKKFGKLLVLEPGKYYNNKYYWKCKCDCGNIIETSESNLVSGRSTQCTVCGHKSSGNKKANELIKIGDRFGKVIVLEKVKNKNPKNTKATYKCKCDCGNIFITTGDLLRKGITTSCGCYRKEKLIDTSIIGKKFGMLTIVDVDSIRKNKKYVKCKCDCGNITIKRYDSLKNGDILSCGCLGESFGERKIEEILNNLSITNKRQYMFDDLLNEEKTAKLRFDSAVKSRNGKKLYGLIEYDGVQHYQEVPFFKTPLEKVKAHDKLKDDYCKEHNIPLLRIPYWEFNNIEKIITEFIETNFNFLLHKN